MSRPWKNTRPDVGLNTPAMTLNGVVLPTPFGPMIPSISPLTAYAMCQPGS